MFPLVSDISKEWHNAVPNDLRSHLIQKLVSGLIPALKNVTAPIPKDMARHILNLAKSEEKRMFELADSRAQYYLMLAEKIYKWQQDSALNVPILDTEQMQTNAAEDPKAWQTTITQGLREHIVNKIKDSLVCPWYPEPALDLATKAENICFEAAKTRSEYYNLVADNIYRMQQALEDRKITFQATSSQPSDVSQTHNLETKLLLEEVLNAQPDEDQLDILMKNLDIISPT